MELADLVAFHKLTGQAYRCKCDSGAGESPPVVSNPPTSESRFLRAEYPPVDAASSQ